MVLIVGKPRTPVYAGKQDGFSRCQVDIEKVRFAVSRLIEGHILGGIVQIIHVFFRKNSILVLIDQLPELGIPAQLKIKPVDRFNLLVH
ncbi:hypothetical protein D3C75_221760 [compost metagenome]